MASLTGTKIKNTYDGLLKTTDNEPLDGTLRAITDGLGNNSALNLSTAGASVGGTLAVSGISTFDNKVGIGSSSFEAFDVLHISGTNAVANDLTFIGPSTSQVRIKFGAPSSLDGEIAYDNDAKSMKFRTNSSERLLLNSSGASVTGTLTVSSDTSNAAQIRVLRSNSISGTYLGLGTVGGGGSIQSVNGDLNLSADPDNTGSDSSIIFNVDGTERMLIDSTGASVTGTLAVSGNATFDTNTLFVDAANNRVGVGTASPTLALSVVGQVRAGESTTAGLTIGLSPVSVPNSDLNAYVVWGSAATFGGNNGDLIYVPRTSTAADHRFYAGSGAATEKMRIYSGGDISFRDSSANEAFYWDASAASLGIGTTSPSSYGGYSALTLNGASNGGVIDFKIGDTRKGSVYNTAAGELFVFDATSATGGISLQTNSTERMRIDSSGNVLIGATSPTGGRQELRIGGSAAGSAITMGRSGTNKFLIQVDSGDNVYLQNTANTPMSFETNGTERMRITSEGYLGISTSSTEVLSGDLLGSLSFVSRDVSTYSSGGVTGIRSYATSSYNTGNVSGDLRFYTSDSLQNTTGTYLFGSERMRILPTGGITFNGDTSSANALDDYEEGTWTPTFTNLTVTGSVTYSGRYTKIGNHVYFVAIVTRVSGDVGATGSLTYINNLPVAPAFDSADAGAGRDGSLAVSGGAYVRAASSQCWLPTIPLGAQGIVISGNYIA